MSEANCRRLPRQEKNGTINYQTLFKVGAHPIKQMTSGQSLFFQKFGITTTDLQRYLGEALSAGGEYADLYFEYLTSTSISVDESMVKSASQGISAGCGVRVLAGERTGYAYTDDLAPEKILRAARTAALIARGPGQQPLQSLKETASHQLYQVSSPSADAAIAAKLELVMRADRAARAYDPRIIQVQCGYADELRQILVVGSDGIR
jgi:TldD protein